MNDIISIIFKPSKEFQSVAENKVSWIILFIALLLLTLINAILSFPVAEQLLKHSPVLAKLPPEQADLMKNFSQKMQYVGLIGAAFMFIAKILAFALLVYGGVYVFKGKIKFEQALTIVLLVNFIVVLGDLANTGILFATGIGNIHTQFDAYKTGLNILTSENKTGPGLYTFLAYINPFQVWYVLLLILGIRTVTGMSKSSSASVALIIWLLTISFMVVVSVAGAMAMAKAGM